MATKRNKPQVVCTLDPRIIQMLEEIGRVRVCTNNSETITLLIREAFERIRGNASGGVAGSGSPAGISQLNDAPAMRAVKPRTQNTK